MRQAAFFDLDKTLVRVNTGRLYAKWRYSRGESSLREVLRVAKWMAQYTMGVVDAQAITEKAMQSLVGVSEAQFQEEMREWFFACVVSEITDAARQTVLRYQKEEIPTVVLSASSNYACDLLAKELRIPHVVSTQLELVDGCFTGRAIELCYGPAKLKMASSWAATHDVDLSISSFYTDSISDLPMLLAVGNPQVINPDPRLRRAAKRYGWTVQQWR